MFCLRACMCAQQHPKLSSAQSSISFLQLLSTVFLRLSIKFKFCFLLHFFIVSSFSYEIEVVN